MVISRDTAIVPSIRGHLMIYIRPTAARVSYFGGRYPFTVNL